MGKGGLDVCECAGASAGLRRWARGRCSIVLYSQRTERSQEEESKTTMSRITGFGENRTRGWWWRRSVLGFFLRVLGLSGEAERPWNISTPRNKTTNSRAGNGEIFYILRRSLCTVYDRSIRFV